MYDITIWIAEGFLALFFFVAGVPKMIGAVSERWAGFEEVPRGLVTLIGIAEIAGGIGLVAPQWSGIAVWLTPWAGLGIVVIALMGSGFHLRRQEWPAAVGTALWALLATAVVIARWGDVAHAPSISRHNVLPGVVLVLIVAVLANLVVLSRATSAKPAGTAEARQAG